MDGMFPIMGDEEDMVFFTCTIRADDAAGAEAVTMKLGSMKDMQALLVSAIDSTPGIEDVTEGKIEVQLPIIGKYHP